MSATILTRIRFEVGTLTRLDRLACELGAKLGRDLSRAAIVRAIVNLYADALATDPNATDALDGDVVRRGRGRRPT